MGGEDEGSKSAGTSDNAVPNPRSEKLTHHSLLGHQVALPLRFFFRALLFFNTMEIRRYYFLNGYILRRTVSLEGSNLIFSLEYISSEIKIIMSYTGILFLTKGAERKKCKKILGGDKESIQRFYREFLCTQSS